MAAGITHHKVNPFPPSSDPNQIDSVAWNSDHDIDANTLSAALGIKVVTSDPNGSPGSASQLARDSGLCQLWLATGGTAWTTLVRSDQVRIYNVMTFGAAGDGTTDDSAAIRSAITKAATDGGGAVFMPGVHMVSRLTGTNTCIKITGTDITLYGVRGRSVLKQVANVSSGTTSCAVIQISKARRVAIRDLTIDGNWGNAQTTIASGSDGATLPQSTINVADTVGFPSSGTFELVTPSGAQIIAYTGKTSTTFTGCTGGTGTVRGDGDSGRIGYTIGLRSPANTHVTSPSNGHTLPQSTIDAASTSAFPSSGQILITSDAGDQTVTYTGKTSSTFTGCTGGTGTIATSNSIWGASNGINQLTQRDPKNYGIWCYGQNGDNVDIEISHVDFRQTYGDGLWFGGDATAGSESGSIGGSRGVTVRDCTFDMCGRNGISLIYADGVRIENCRFKNIVTTAIDTEPVDFAVNNVVITGCTLQLWWNQFVDPTKNALSISGGTVARPSEWNYAQGFRVSDCTIHGTIYISDALDVRVHDNTVWCDFDSPSTAPIYATMYLDDIRIERNKVYARNGGIDDTNRGAIQVVRYQANGTAAMTAAGVHVRDNDVYARNGMDGIYITPGGSAGFSGTATTVTATTLVQTSAGWTTDQFLGHTIVRGTAVATIESNTSDTLTLATWHHDGVHGWVDARGNVVATPSTGAFTIQPMGGVVEVIDNTIDCVASDGQAAGRYGVHLTTTSTWATTFADIRAIIKDNTTRGGNPHGIHVFLYDTPAIRFLAVEENAAYDNQPVPTCTHGVFFDSNSGTFDPVAQVGKLLVRDNFASDSVRSNVGGLTQGYWLIEDGTQQRWTGYGSPATVIAAPVGSTMIRKDGGTSTTFYVKEAGGLPLSGTHKTDQTGAGLTKTTDQTLALDAVTTTDNNSLVVQALVAVPGSGNSAWDQWTNTALVGFSQIVQNTDSNGTGDFAAAAGVLPAAGSSGAGTVRQHAASSEFGNGSYSFALKPQVPVVAPAWIANGTQTQGTTGSINPPWPTHLENDVGILFVLLHETDTGATISDPQWVELPGSPVLGQSSGVGAKMHIFGARAYKSSMSAPTVSHSGANIMGAILLFRGASNGSADGWVAK